MLKFYLSPAGFNLFEYNIACRGIVDFGWHLTFAWPVKSFSDGFKNPNTFKKAVVGISQAELFIAMVPAPGSLQLLEIGLAYAWCDEVVLAGKSKFYSFLPEATHFICNQRQLPGKLKEHYLYLVSS